MSPVEAYFLLFFDSLVSHLAFTNSNELIFNTMQTFGAYNSYIILVVAAGAYLLSIIINYFFGRVCYNILFTKIADPSISTDRINSVRESKYLPLVILLSFISFYGKFIILVMGFCRVNIYQVMSLALISKTLFYSYLIWFQ